MNKTFNVTGSTGNSYTVTFSDQDGSLHAHCTCEAASFNTLCKHITHIIDTDSEVQQELDTAGLLSVYQEFNDQLKESERIKRKAKKLKDSFAKQLLIK